MGAVEMLVEAIPGFLYEQGKDDDTISYLIGNYTLDIDMAKEIARPAVCLRDGHESQRIKRPVLEMKIYE